MTEERSVSGTDFLNQLIQLLSRLGESQAEGFKKVAGHAADAVAGGGLVHVFGSGHSVIPVLDAFPRYGAFVGINPLTDPRLMWWNVLGPGGVRELLWLERAEGYVEQFLANHPIASGDVLIVISHGGRNPAPIEAAIYGRKRGAITVGVTSIANRQRPPEHSSGKHLSDLVDIVIDTGVPIEDALIQLEGFERPVGGASTIVACAAVSEIMVHTAVELQNRGITPPIFVSPTVPGATVQSNDEVFAAHRQRLLAAAARV
jgi:uncharacterized phosphosugar-binding protein